MKKIAVLLLLALIFALAGCSSTDTNTTNNQNAVSNQSGDISNENIQTANTPTTASNTHDNSSAVLTKLFSGKFTVGQDIPAGRYVITGDGSGNLFVYDKNGLPIISEILGESMGIGVPSVTTDIEAGNEIEISGINNVTFTPAVTDSSTKLTTGTWVVGLDIPAGKYDATCDDDKSGNLFVYDGILPIVSEILDKSGMGIGVEKTRVDLKDGQKIQISGMPSVSFVSA